MKTKAHKFLSILKMELEEIEEDLKTLLEIYRCHEQKHEITNYVLQENSSLIQAEIAAILFPPKGTNPSRHWQRECSQSSRN